MRMCQYCNYAFTDGWSQLLQYDDVYQRATGQATQSTHGFHESWAELREDIGV